MADLTTPPYASPDNRREPRLICIRGEWYVYLSGPFGTRESAEQAYLATQHEAVPRPPSRMSRAELIATANEWVDRVQEAHRALAAAQEQREKYVAACYKRFGPSWLGPQTGGSDAEPDSASSDNAPTPEAQS